MNSVTKKFQVPRDPLLSLGFLSLRETANQSTTPETDRRRHFFSWARNGIYHCLRAARLCSGDSVLVPSYICKAVPEAIQGYGAKVIYYSISKDCQPNFSDLADKIDARTRALIAVHYFGFPQPADDLREFCNRRELYFIEDCAHVLRSELGGRPLGSFGDASVFSLRKFFPLYDGAELILNRPQDELEINWTAESPLYTLKTAKDILDQVISRSTSPILQVPYEFLMMSLVRHAVGGFKSRPGLRALAVEKTDAAFDIQLVNLPMSRLSSMIYSHFDTSRIVSQRKANYSFLQRELLSLPGLRFLSAELPIGVCPWVFPVIFNEREDACRALREEGIPARNWEGVRPTDLPNDVFPGVDFLYRNLVFLPVHQDLTAEHLQRIVLAVKQVLEAPAPASAPAPAATPSPPLPSDAATIIPLNVHSSESVREGTKP
jgi:perosamine synthetase